LRIRLRQFEGRGRLGHRDDGAVDVVGVVGVLHRIDEGDERRAPLRR